MLDSTGSGVDSPSVFAASSFWGSKASPYSNAFVMNRLTAPRYASPTSYRNMNCYPTVRLLFYGARCSILTKKVSDNVSTSSLERKPSLFLSCRLKNHSILSMRSLNMTPSKPDIMSSTGVSLGDPGEGEVELSLGMTGYLDVTYPKRRTDGQ